MGTMHVKITQMRRTAHVRPICFSVKKEAACKQLPCVMIKLIFFNIFSRFRLDFKCSDNQFRCTNGECVKKNLLCDGDYACKDHSDEENCACPTNMFQCKEGGCLQATALCDDTKQDGCDGEDEINCRKSPYFITRIVLYFPLPHAKKLKVN